jgi:hypothetical protein
MPAALLHFSSLRRSQHNYVRAMPALKFQQKLATELAAHMIRKGQFGANDFSAFQQFAALATQSCPEVGQSKPTRKFATKPF